jgi:hypothetical protein
MAIAMLMLVDSLVYALCMREDINLRQFLLLTFFICSKSHPSSMDIVGLLSSHSDSLRVPFVSC